MRHIQRPAAEGGRGVGRAAHFDEMCCDHISISDVGELQNRARIVGGAFAIGSEDNFVGRQVVGREPGATLRGFEPFAPPRIVHADGHGLLGKFLAAGGRGFEARPQVNFDAAEQVFAGRQGRLVGRVVFRALSAAAPLRGFRP